MVSDLVTPIIAAIGGKPDFNNLSFSINNSRFLYGHFINALITFASIAAVVYFFVVKPFSALLERLMPKKEIGPTRECPECLSDIPAAARRCSFCTSEVGPAPVATPA
jgi:large conductance mechanosensitive channel